jgi:hypothetical protein
MDYADSSQPPQMNEQPETEQNPEDTPYGSPVNYPETCTVVIAHIYAYARLDALYKQIPQPITNQAPESSPDNTDEAGADEPCHQ